MHDVWQTQRNNGYRIVLTCNTLHSYSHHDNGGSRILEWLAQVERRRREYRGAAEYRWGDRGLGSGCPLPMPPTHKIFL